MCLLFDFFPLVSLKLMGHLLFRLENHELEGVKLLFDGLFCFSVCVDCSCFFGGVVSNLSVPSSKESSKTWNQNMLSKYLSDALREGLSFERSSL